MKIITPFIHPNEPAHGLFEGPQLLPSPNGKGNEHRWVQWVWVVRDDYIAKWEKDYGPALNFERVQSIFIPGFGDDSVAEVQDMAEKNRNDFYWADQADQMLAESTLIKDHLAMVEQKLLHKQNRSRFGPGINTQRNDFSRQLIQGKVKDKLNGNRN